MTTDLITLNENECISTARDLMARQQIRHMPIISDDDQFVGLISQRDIMRFSLDSAPDLNTPEQQDAASCIKIGDVMTREVNAADEEMSLKEAAQYLIDHKYGCLPVLNDGYLSGIITESDFVKLAVHLLDRLDDD
jgi:CBS domain-containing membrane protein